MTNTVTAGLARRQEASLIGVGPRATSNGLQAVPRQRRSSSAPPGRLDERLPKSRRGGAPGGAFASGPGRARQTPPSGGGPPEQRWKTRRRRGAAAAAP